VSNYAAQPQSLADAAKDIKELIAQLSGDYDITNQSGKMGLSGKVIESVEKNPTLKSRTINALKEAGKKALEEAIDHPVAKVLVAGLEGFME
jgi:internalin A